MSEQNELVHYGVKGMKWGIVRSRSRLSGNVDKLRRRNARLSSEARTLDRDATVYEARSTQMKSRNSKYESRLTSATAKKAKYDLKLNKQLSKRHPNGKKIAKYTRKSNKYNVKIMKAQKKLKYNKWAVKAEKTRLAADIARAKIAKNKKVMNTYSKTMDALDKGTIERGRLFMQYVTE